MGRMKEYFFALGTNHTLSKIDIVNTLLKKGVNFEIIEASEEILLVATTAELGVEQLIGELGSAAKIGKVLRFYQKDKWPEEFLMDIQKSDLKEKLAGERFGISVCGVGGKYKELNEVFYSARKIGEEIRGILDIREVRGEGRVLSTVAVDKNGLLKDGFELVLCVGSKGIYVGKTLVIQDYESYSFRDYGRPRRDARSGMIPPKLAKMMINLAGKGKEDVFLDPFCGSGTILQELILLGYKNIVGTDVGGKRTEDSRINLEWLFENYRSLKRDGYKIDIFQCDAKNLSAKISPQTVDAIVSEPYLGSAERKFLKLEEVKEEISQLEGLYFAAFSEFRKILKDGGAIVIVFPVFRYGNKFFYLQILEKIYSSGFKSGKFLFKEPEGAELLKLQITKRNSVIFFRPGQAVSREIFIFERS